MKRFRTLMFCSFSFFKQWYLYMKQRVNTLILKSLKLTNGTQQVKVTVVY